MPLKKAFDRRAEADTDVDNRKAPFLESLCDSIIGNDRSRKITEELSEMPIFERFGFFQEAREERRAAMDARVAALADTSPEERAEKIVSFFPARESFRPFAAVYARELFPEFERLENKRVTLRETFKQAQLYALGLAIAAFVLSRLASSLLSDGWGGFVLMGGLALAFCVYYFPKQALDKVVSGARQTVIDSLAHELALTYQRAATKPESFLELNDWGLFPDHNREAFEDRFEGTYHGAEFDFCEAQLQKVERRGKSTTVRTVFTGYCLHIHFKRSLFGKTVLAPKAANTGLSGFFRRQIKKRGVKPVGIVASAFEDRFSVYSSDQTEARYILDPAFLEQLIDFEQSFDGKNLRALFEGDHILLAVEGKDLFELSSHEKFTDPAIVGRLLHELDSIFNLIDFILKRHNTGQ